MRSDFIIETLRAANAVESVHVILHYSSGYHHRNGGGDAIRTDGHLPIIDLHPPDRLLRSPSSEERFNI